MANTPWAYKSPLTVTPPGDSTELVEVLRRGKLSHQFLGTSCLGVFASWREILPSRDVKIELRRDAIDNPMLVNHT